ncbi:MAG: hypothetical protein EOO88_56380 [Pedobacter sp.]|nr:MAG: hypothetical protein EOO88_56380 [Pedobacter sp.]
METRWLLHQVNQQIMTTYHAPWGKTLKIVSALLVVLAIASLAGAPYLPDRISAVSKYQPDKNVNAEVDIAARYNEVHIRDAEAQSCKEDQHGVWLFGPHVPYH